MNDPIFTEIDQLRAQINKASHAFHVIHNPIMSDSDFDKLFQRLVELERRYPQYSNAYSPTQQVGHKPGKRFRKVKHRTRMLSLDNVFNEKEVDEFVSKFPGELYVLDPKYDGLALNLTYVDGALVTVGTRGDGTTGEDITANILKLFTVPRHLVGNNIPKILEVCGECLFRRDKFEMVNHYLMARKKKPYSNARNAVAGIVRQKSSAFAEQTQPDFVAYGIGYTTIPIAETHTELVDVLGSYGFMTSKATLRTAEGALVNDVIAKNSFAMELPYETDGMVIRINNLERQESIGNTAHHPRYAVAYKFPSVPVRTILRDIELQVGRTGVVTPVAILEPVVISNVTVTRTTLHNFDEIDRLGLRIKDTVEVIRAGEVIPKIVRVIKEARGRRARLIPTPTHCPSCSTPLMIDHGEEVSIYCPNGLGCPAQQQRILEHFASRKALDIKGIGASVAEKMMNGYPRPLTRPSDLFYLDLGDFKRNFGLTAGVARNIFDAVQQARRTKLDKVIYAMGIRHVGNERAKIIAAHVGRITGLPSLTYEELVAMEDIGDQVARSIVSFFQNPINRDECFKLDAALSIEAPDQSAIKNQSMKGERVVITGSFTMNRELIIDRLEKLGAKVTDSVTSKTTMLFVGANPGSKVAAAEKLGITRYEEGDLMALIGD